MWTVMYVSQRDGKFVTFQGQEQDQKIYLIQTLVAAGINYAVEG